MSGAAREEGLAEVTIRQDLKEVREQVPRGRRHPPGPEAGAGGSGSSGKNGAASLGAGQDVRAGTDGARLHGHRPRYRFSEPGYLPLGSR